MKSMTSMLFAVLLTLHSVAKSTDPVVTPPPQNKVPANLILIQKALIADKATRTLTLWENQNGQIQLVGSYPMDIGKNNGDKVAEGDHRTPNGIYFPQKRLEREELNFSEYGIRAFTLDYPNFYDVRAGKTGSGIWVHAIPDTTSLNRGSRGCVVVRNAIIEELTPHIDLEKTAVVITEQVQYINRSEHDKITQEVQAWLESWRKSWMQKELDTYMNFYADEFQALKMNKSKWRRYKQGLNERYKTIEVALSQPRVIKHNNQMVLRFQQDYKSAALSDTGIKTLYTDVGSGRPLILTEVWQAPTSAQNQVSQFAPKDPANF